MSKLTHEELCELVSYDEKTKTLIWKVTRGNGYKGFPIGRIGTDGYYIVGINGKTYRRSRIVWFYFNKEWPVGHLDHKNTIKADDSLSNLRIATSYENNLNRKSSKLKRKYDLPKWVGLNAGGKTFRAEVRCEGKRYRLGTFNCADEAHAVAAKFAKEKHGEFFNSGK